MITLRPSTNRDTTRILDIWSRAVDATHCFLLPTDRAAIGEEVEAFLPQMPLMLAVNVSDYPLGFMFLHEGHMEALFIDPDHHGKGIGKALVQAAIATHPGLTTDVNEQNIEAMGFYCKLGFEPTGRSDLDGQGRPYPLVHLRFRATEK
ncbi:acetyltransferase [Agrobacterium genomosp. 3 str. CIP 111-78]|uniref:Acetyltransferase n=1 Tax=Agrobacterium tumefaciens TaxID=358 RepID=A0AAE6BQS4_AGRTU|nr:MULTISPECIES: acetyltransferase [Agrobacterium tumefaciens complex]MCA2370952.1 acetyltransferase [Agrobacterium tomkonis CIP 111-78]QCM02512.1 acetyltransferase [Agrobacterium tumefaciens]